MKIRHLLTAGFTLVVILLSSSFIAGQGPLTPPGAPAPTMKTLDQIEARIPISTVPFTIAAPGSYYLTGNVSVGTAASHAITINADRVTLDLNGFTISSSHPFGSGTAIPISAFRKGITIRNGKIQGDTTYSGGAFNPGGFLSGITAINTYNVDIVIEDITVAGMSSYGIYLNYASDSGNTVRRCAVNIAGNSGIIATRVESCTVDTVDRLGISANVIHSCTARVVGTTATDNAIVAENVHASHGTADAGTAIDAGDTVSDSTGTSATGAGIVATNIATNCRGTSSGNNIGLSASNATNCQGTSATSTGLAATNATNCRGISTSGIGLNVIHATNCQGSSGSGIGLNANNATNSSGSTNTGAVGLDANPGTASFCRGNRSTGGTAITAGIAIGCTVATGTVNSANKFLGTP